MTSRVLEPIKTYQVDLGWVLPEPDGTAAGAAQVSREETSYSDLYYDTTDYLLLGHGLTVRRRGTEWLLAAHNEESTAEVLSVRSHSGGAVPARVQSLVAGAAAGQPLSVVAKIDTRRTQSRITDPAGKVLAEITDDKVTATRLGDAAEISGWRQVAMAPGADKGIRKKIRAALRSAEAIPANDAASVLAATLGVERRPSWQRVPRGAISATVGNYLDTQYRALVAADLQLRQDQDPIHPTRVATRRFRSVLRTFKDLFDPDRAAAMDTELAWYAALLGEVRDQQVLRARLQAQVHDLPPELVLGPVAARVEEQLLGRQLKARQELAHEMNSPRYMALMADLHSWHQRPPLRERPDQAARTAKKYLRKATGEVAARLSTASQHPADDELLHRARKAGKRARYTAEVLEPILGKTATRSVKRATALQDILGEHQDSLVARDLLRTLGAAAATEPGENGFTFGLLYAHEQQRADTARDRTRRRLKHGTI